MIDIKAEVQHDREMYEREREINLREAVGRVFGTWSVDGFSYDGGRATHPGASGFFHATPDGELWQTPNRLAHDGNPMGPHRVHRPADIVLIGEERDEEAYPAQGW